ncbi:MAG: anhydro-N-acetylmuramic acid kinase [Pseudomonadota bacterium]
MVRTAIGLMSGTSIDGIDAALMRTDGVNAIDTVETLSFPYGREMKVWVQRAVKAALEGRDGAADVGKAAGEITLAHVEAVKALIAKAKLTPAEIDIVGFHGQTILHRPAQNLQATGRTWQIGDGAALASEVEIDVVGDFRSADVAAGGEGAPFAPVYHAALVRKLTEKEGDSAPVAVLNLGGVANVTFVPEGGDETEMLAFDCGPGNGLIDEWVALKTGAAMDEDGALAKRGEVRSDILRDMLLAPYLRRKPPKSLDRYDFKIDPVLPLSTADGAATLTAFSAACVRMSEKHFPEPPSRWIVCGGGRRNGAMMEALRQAVEAPVLTAEDVGWRGDDLEAECFAYLAVRSLEGLPLSFPKTTRAPHAMNGGVHYPARR